MLKYRTMKKILPIAICCVMSSCATIINGGSPLVTIDGDIDEPVTIITEAQTYEDVNLPIEVKVGRRGIDEQHIQIKSDQHKYSDIVLEKKYTGWTAGNYFMGIFPGLITDWATNSNVKPRHKYYNITPGEERRSNHPFRPEVPVNRPHANDFYRHEVSLSMGVSGTVENAYYDLVDRHVKNQGFNDTETCMNSGEGVCLPLSIDYMYNINRRLAVGLSFTRAVISEWSEKVVDVPSVNSSAPTMQVFYDIYSQSLCYATMPSIRYKWAILRKAPLAFYSQLSLGYAHTKFTTRKLHGEGESARLVPYSVNQNRLGYQATFAGMEIGRSYLRSFIEAGVGYKGYMNLGLKYCF